MEIIHPPGGCFQRKEREKSPFVGGDVWLGHGAFGQVWVTRSFLLCGSHPCFRWGPPSQAGCGLTPSYNGFDNNTLKTAITFEIGCADRGSAPPARDMGWKGVNAYEGLWLEIRRRDI